MFFQYDTAAMQTPPPQEESQWWAKELQQYLAPVNERLDAYLDRRVVGNLTAVVAGMVVLQKLLSSAKRNIF